ncbi:MAG: AAA family ATPase, partial [Epsilonproteobacteria bacterium]|nr:AAA family ATPase [Campylobacterota bacterium]
MKKIPYGISDFIRLKSEDFYFIDKTPYIEKIENYPSSFLMFLRPRRFGKSLLIAILEAYYDIHFKSEFEEIFKDTYIIKHKTPEASSYLVLRFDFSAIDVSNVEESFKQHLVLRMQSFVKKYDLAIEFANDRPISMLNHIFDTIQNNNLKLYLLIDEYDNFANKLLLNNQNEYLNLVSQKTASFKQLFTVLKAGASGNNAPIRRMFITGVTPMTMYDVTSGFNIGDNISLHKDFNNMIGLNDSELNEILAHYAIDTKVEKGVLQEWYNNYKFNVKSEAIYNTDMILYFINKFRAENEMPKEMIDINVRSDYSKLKTIIYTNKKLNGNFTTLQTLIGGDSISMSNLVQDFSALDLNKENNFKSFMFYLGL